jgi:zinc protease
MQQRDAPFPTAIRVMNACLFGPSHPYGHTALGTEEALKKISRADMESFYKASYGPKNAALILVGNLTEAEAKKLAQDSFGSWKGNATAAPVPAEGAMANGRVVIVDKAGSNATALLLGQFGVTRANPDYEKLDVMNTVLGGLFSSRINLNLREDKGYSYGAFSFVGQNRGVGPLMAGAQVRGDVTGPSVEELLKEVTKMRDAGVTGEELTLAKEAITRPLPTNFETTASSAGTMAQLYMFDLPLDYYESLPARVNAITTADVAAVAKKYLTPERMVVVAVGDRKAIEPQLQKLNLGNIVIRDADGNEVMASNN